MTVRQFQLSSASQDDASQDLKRNLSTDARSTMSLDLSVLQTHDVEVLANVVPGGYRFGCFASTPFCAIDCSDPRAPIIFTFDRSTRI